jgi:hypothetical protein
LSAHGNDSSVPAAVTGAAQANPAPILDVTFMVAGVRQDGRPALIEQHACAGLAVTLDPAAPGSRSGEAVAVRLPGGAQIGFVPAAEARQIVLRLQQGEHCSAHIVRIRDSGRSPIPVVQVRFFPAGTEATTPLALAATQPLTATGRWGRVLAVLVGIAAALLMLAVLSR